MAQAATMDPSIVGSYLEFQRQRIRTANEAGALAQKRMEEKNAREAAEAQAILESTLTNHRELSPDDLFVVTIPSGISKISPLPEARIQAYKQHLETVIREFRGVPEIDSKQDDAQRSDVTAEKIFENSPKLRTVSEKLCGMCKGGCCTSGGDTAYITRSTIRKFLDAAPESADADIVNAYLSQLSAETMTNSCINQSPTGCVLPRSMRSDTCNEYFCNSLVKWQASAATEMTKAILVIQRKASDWASCSSHERNAVVDVAVMRTGDESVVKYDPTTLKPK
ncbi:MAG: hypothetical protein R3C17_09545 [Planctomycetaceae bacterium]